ncbi:class I tRNA ligase family protein [Myceligenerans crystallogenes]|uniref:Class I tRNA ligase family protein n=1 Tax=Myceligenerans crystallogenes TaxID=316335 RepID=A0ABN2N7J0_9MICO
MPRYIVTAAPPNPNGDLHLGHLSGPFLGADVQARYLRSTGADVVHVSYIDEHSCYVTRRARELGGAAREVAHKLGNRIESTLEQAGMRPDFVGRPHRDARHDQIVQDGFRTLHDQGCFTVETLPVYWCAQDEKYLYEAEIRGECHHCGAPSDGFYCEECGLPQTSGMLAEPRCTTCWTAPEVRQHERLVFDLERWRSALREHYEGQQLRPRLRAFLDGMLSAPLPPTPVSRLGDYGVPVPLPGWEGHYLDTWFSGLWGYVAATEGAARVLGAGAGADAWNHPDTEVIEFLGFDCGFSHAVLWVAFAMASGQVLPRVVTNEFYQLEGGKFSTSRGHAIWGGDVLGRVSVDSLRFYLCLTGPEERQTNFSRTEFADVVREVLTDGLEPFARLLADPDRNAEGDAVASEQLVELTGKVRAGMAAALEPAAFSPSSAAAILADFVADRSGEAAKLAQAASAAARIRALRDLATAVTPIMPGWAEDVLRAVGDGQASVGALVLGAGHPGWLIERDGKTSPVRSLALTAVG